MEQLIAWLIGIPLLASPLIYLSGRLWRRHGRFSLRRTPFATAGNSDHRLLNTSCRLRTTGPAHWLALGALAGAGLPLALAWQAYATEGSLTLTIGMVALRLDGLSLLIASMSLVLSLLVCLYSMPAMAGRAGEESYYALLPALAGTIIGLGCAADLFNLWLWVEGALMSSYLLVAFYTERPATLEATLRYLVQSATGSTLALMAIALVLATTGTLDLVKISVSTTSLATDWPILAAGAFFVAGFGVKAALVPMHTWLPDVYVEAPDGISALMAGIVTKVGLVALLRVVAPLSGLAPWGSLLLVVGAVNMLAGNLLALRETQLKRMLAYSSLSHIGWIVLATAITLLTGDPAGTQSGFFHLVNHGLMIALAFMAAGILAHHRRPVAEPERQPLTIEELAGMGWHAPGAGIALALALFSLGGIPPLAGFISKWQILAAAMATGDGIIIIFALFAAVNTLLSLAYYMPVVIALYRPTGHPTDAAGWARGSLAMNLPATLLAMAVVAIGLWPQLVLRLVEPAAAAWLLTLAR